MTIDVSKGWFYRSYMNPLSINVAHTYIWWGRLANFGGNNLISYLFSQYMILGTKITSSSGIQALGIYLNLIEIVK
jgi:hypothetical protein